MRGLPGVIPLDNEAHPLTEQPISKSSMGISQHKLGSPKQDQVQPESPLVRRVRKSGHGCIVLSRWDKLFEIIDGKDKDLAIDGESLDPAIVVAIAR